MCIDSHYANSCPQVGKFVVNEPENASAQPVPENQLPQDLHFPKKLRGEGVRGHFYHDFEPKYYL